MMKYSYHVITPLARFQNLSKLIRMLEPHQIQWHVITDDVNPFRISFDQSWIHHHICPNIEKEFWSRAHYAINWFLDYVPLIPDHRYCWLNDDDAYEPLFFKKIDAHGGDVVVCSMDRGHQTPADAEPLRAHGCCRLEAIPENMHPGMVGGEQVIVSGSILSQCRLPMIPSGDGAMIEYLAATYPVTYVRDASVQFNYFEPGRWNK